MRPISISAATLLVTLALSPARAQDAAACRPPEQQSGDSLIIPIELENYHVYVAVCVGDRPFSFILDTGAGQSFFDLRLARQLGFSTGSEFRANGAGPGTIAGAQLQGASVTLAGTSLRQRVGAALDLSSLPAREGHRMDGILGADFIASRVLVIDYAASKLRLYDRATFRYTGNGASVPIAFASGHPHVDGQIVLGSGDTLRARFVIDVGSSGNLALGKPFVDDNRLRERVGPTLRRPGGVGVGGQTFVTFGRVSALRLGSIALANVVTSLHGDSAGVFSNRGSWDGNIGGDILRRFTVFFDYVARRMILEPNAAFGDSFDIDMSGVGFVASGDQWTVDFVVPNAPAMEAGIERGDVVLEIDGQPADARAITALRRRLRRADERVTLTIRRGTGGETKKVTVVTRRLV